MFLLQIALLAAASEPRPQPVPAKPAAREAKCPYEQALRTIRSDAPKRTQRLGELPPAEHFYAVHREEDGCLTPVKVRERG